MLYDWQVTYDINWMMCHLYFAMYLLCQQVTCHGMSYDIDRMMCHLYFVLQCSCCVDR